METNNLERNDMTPQAFKIDFNILADPKHLFCKIHTVKTDDLNGQNVETTGARSRPSLPVSNLAGRK